MRRFGIGVAGAGRMGRVHLGSLTGRCATAEPACVFDVG